MNKVSRRQFVGIAAGLAGLSVTDAMAYFGKKSPKLAFSTLGAPKWSYDQIIESAHKFGYQGIEIRGILDQMDLPLCPEFSSPEAIRQSLSKAKKHGVKIVGLGASARLHDPEGPTRAKNLDEARRFIDLAQNLECPYVRVFPNNLPKNQDREETIKLIVSGLKELGEYARGKKVMVLLESHGEVVGKDLLHRIMKESEHPNVGLIWDIFNMWSVTKESPTEVYSLLGKYIRHVHIKDAVREGDKWRYVQVGQGVAPLKEAMACLIKGGYKGYYAFEWEKKWHPTIPEPEEVFPEFPHAIAPMLKV